MRSSFPGWHFLQPNERRWHLTISTSSIACRPTSDNVLTLVPQFLLLELEDGTFAMMLPLISQQTFRGTLRPPRQACCYCAACCAALRNRGCTGGGSYRPGKLQRLSAAQQ